MFGVVRDLQVRVRVGDTWVYEIGVTHLQVQKPVHVRRPQCGGRPRGADDGHTCPFCTPPALSDAVCPGGVAYVGTMTGFVVTVFYHFDVAGLAPPSQLQSEQGHKNTAD
mgnify:CR=1 FL=1